MVPAFPAAPPVPGTTGRATFPSAKELAAPWGPPRPPLIAPATAPQFPPTLYDMFDWSVQQGWSGGDMGQWLWECVYGFFFHFIGWIPQMAPVPRELRRPSLVTGEVGDWKIGSHGGMAA